MSPRTSQRSLVEADHISPSRIIVIVSCIFIQSALDSFVWQKQISSGDGGRHTVQKMSNAHFCWDTTLERWS